MESLLLVRDLTVCYGARQASPVRALSGVGFDLAPGEAIGVLGESGSGKTTLAMALLGLLPRGGRVECGAALFRGTDILTRSERQMRRIRGAGISLVHQEPGVALNPALRVGQQVAEVLCAHNHLSAQQARKESKDLLAQVGFTAESRIDEAFPHQLSGGQQQRVVIAQAIACHPALIIADEPTTALDAAAQLEILALLRRLQQKLNLAIILITHNPAMLTSIAHRILVMYAGRVVEQGPIGEILQSPLHPYTQGLLRCGLDSPPQGSPRRLLGSISGEPPNLAALPAGCAFAPRCPERMDVCAQRAPAERPAERSRLVSCFKYE